MSALQDQIIGAKTQEEADALAQKAYRDKYGGFSYGGSEDAYQRAMQAYRDRGAEPKMQDRITPDNRQFSADQSLLANSQGAQQQGLNYWQSMANGTGPNSGESAYNANLQNSIANQRSLAAGARGGAYSNAAAGHLAEQNAANMTLGAANDLAALRARGQMQGMAGYANQANALRQGSLGATGLDAQWAQANQQALLDQRSQDIANTQYYGGLAHQTAVANQGGLTKGLLGDMGQVDYARQKQVEEAQRNGQAVAAGVSLAGQLTGAGFKAYGKQEEDDEKRKRGY